MSISIDMAQFVLEMCLAARNRQKNPEKNPILAFKVIQGH